MRFRRFLRVTCLKRVQRYSPELRVAFKLFSKRFEGVEPQKKLVVELHFDMATGDLQIFELTAQEDDAGLWMVGRVFGRKPGHQSVCRHHILDVQAFDRSSN